MAMDRKAAEIWEQWNETESSETIRQLGDAVRKGGYSLFSRLTERLKRRLIECGDDDLDDLRRLLQKGREMLPDPGKLSPAWDGLWEKWERILETKARVLAGIAPEEREGEWQILMDNPLTHDSIAVYPGLTFLEAAWLYGYFLQDLQPNEYIRLQKIVTLLTEEGR